MNDQKRICSSVEDEEGNFDLQRLTLNTQVSALNVQRQVVLVVRVPHHVNHQKVFAGQVGICIRELSYFCSPRNVAVRKAGDRPVNRYLQPPTGIPPGTFPLTTMCAHREQAQVFRVYAGFGI